MYILFVSSAKELSTLPVDTCTCSTRWPCRVCCVSEVHCSVAERVFFSVVGEQTRIYTAYSIPCMLFAIYTCAPFAEHLRCYKHPRLERKNTHSCTPSFNGALFLPHYCTRNSATSTRDRATSTRNSATSTLAVVPPGPTQNIAMLLSSTSNHVTTCARTCVPLAVHRLLRH